jgi:segregation and condensation protein B
LVAYRQPISHADVEASGKKNAGNLLRQLLRRELVAITRIDKSRNGVQYHTTPRFLSLFGLGSLDELPQADALNLR